MATRTIFACDRCGKEKAETRNAHGGVTSATHQTWQFVVSVAHERVPTSSMDAKFGATWCRACAEEFGFVPRVETKAPDPPKPEPTHSERIEALLREFVREEIEAAKGER